MATRRRIVFALAAVTAVSLIVAAGGRTGRAAPTPQPFTCGQLTVPFGAAVPGDAPALSSQLDANCFAWWEAIALNWPAGRGGFGDPGDLGAVQWETYMPRELVFPPGGASPPPWGAQPSVPPDCGSATRLLKATSKFTSTFSFPSDIAEAFPIDQPNWVGAQNGTNLWYEIRLNKDEYDSVVAHRFYNAGAQAAWVANGTGKAIVLPRGASGGPVGAVEMKAAWMEVPNPGDPRWARYKLSPAAVLDPALDTCRLTTVALVGFHIIHKTRSQPTWLWATFEHVDNVPSPSGCAGAGGTYNLCNPSCQPQVVQVPAACLAPGAKSPVTVGCTPNSPPPYYLGPGCPGPVPIQVARTTPLDSDAQNANAIAQKAIAAAFPRSVWANYQLVNVVWSTSPVPDPKKPVKVPLPLAGMLPAIKVANTTMETYAQNLTCTDCHRGATIAPTAASPNPLWDSDFSFALGTATESPAPAQAGKR